MIRDVVEKYYLNFKETLEKTDNKKLKNVVCQLNELDDFTKEIVLRKCASESASAILLQEIDPSMIEESLSDAILECIEIVNSMNKKYIFRVKVKGLEKYITREIAIPKKFLLSDLGIAIVLAFNGDFSHLMEFKVNSERYVMDPENDYFDHQKCMFDYELDTLDLNSKTKMRLTYDFGDNYEFDIKFVKEVDGIGKSPIEILKGKGYGIIEDHHMFLEMVYANPDLSVEPYIGEDMTVKEYLEFEDVFDIEETNDYLNSMFIGIKEALESDEDEEFE